MVRVSSIIVTLVTLGVTSALPIQKRVAQVIAEATRDWEQACLGAGGGQKCNPVSVAAFSTLLAAPGPCAQQDAADAMIDLAKTLNNNAEMIRLTQLFRQQARNAPDSLSVLYCQSPPRNSELNGLFNCQFQGVNPKVFTGNVAIGAPGTIPFGLSAPVSPPGSCPAFGSAIPDGKQLNQLVSSPGSGAPASGKPPANTTAPAATPAPSQTASSPPKNQGANGPNVPFAVQNGRDAQALNEKFARLTPNSPCTDGEQACVQGSFAQCVGGRFVLTKCGGGLQCFDLPLVNSRGTSITCTTPADANDRIARALGTAGPGATAPPTPSNPPQAPIQPPKPSPSAVPAPNGNKPFALQNGLAAQALNRKFAALKAGDSCTPGENACADGGFAQCVGGSFVVTQCASTLVCAGLPLVNSPGTSITCTTPADVIARIAATGASASATGN